MPLTLPAFSQYQGPIIPLRGLWNKAPPEGDYFVNAEIDWGSQANSAVQMAFSGNSPVAISQIVALYVDNRRCGVDCDFQFPDSGFLLTVPAHAQGLFPVLTNALMFYVIANGAGSSDVTIVQVLNSLPPPIALVISTQQNSVAITGVLIAASTTPLIANTVSGTVNTLSLSIAATGSGNFGVSIQDGTGAVLWANFFDAPGNFPVDLSGLNVRFRQGLNLVVSGISGAPTGAIDANVFYSTP